MKNLSDIIPDSEISLKQAISETDNQKETLMAFIGWPTDHWHWDALGMITGKTYEELKAEIEPED
jgi:hypothetical protein